MGFNVRSVTRIEREDRDIVDRDSPHLYLGRGFDSFRLLPLPTAAIIGEFSGNAADTAQKISLTRVDSHSELRQFFGAKVSGGSAFASGAFAWASNTQLIENNLYILLLAHWEKVTQGYKPGEYSYSDKALQDVDHLTKAEFWIQYGDSFISEVKLGGYLLLLYTINTKSFSHKEDFSASLNLETGMTTWSGEFQKQIVAVSHRVDVSLDVTSAGLDVFKVPQKPDEVEGLMADFPRLLTVPGALVSFKTSFYPRTGATNSPSPSKLFNAEDLLDEFNEAEQSLLKAQRLIGICEGAIESPHRYTMNGHDIDDHGEEGIQDLKNNLQHKVALLSRNLEKRVKNPVDSQDDISPLPLPLETDWPKLKTIPLDVTVGPKRLEEKGKEKQWVGRDDQRANVVKVRISDDFIRQTAQIEIRVGAYFPGSAGTVYTWHGWVDGETGIELDTILMGIQIRVDNPRFVIRYKALLDQGQETPTAENGGPVGLVFDGTLTGGANSVPYIRKLMVWMEYL